MSSTTSPPPCATSSRSRTNRLNRRPRISFRADARAASRRLSAASRSRGSADTPGFASITGGSVLQQKDIEVARRAQPLERTPCLAVQGGGPGIRDGCGEKAAPNAAAGGTPAIGARLPDHPPRGRERDSPSPGWRSPGPPWRAPRPSSPPGPATPAWPARPAATCQEGVPCPAPPSSASRSRGDASEGLSAHPPACPPPVRSEAPAPVRPPVPPAPRPRSGPHPATTRPGRRPS